MIKVLDKAFTILELIVTAATPCQVSWLAEKAGIPFPTCSRILKDLSNANYIVQISRNEGYAAGPRAFVLGQAVNYQQNKLSVIRPALRQLAEQHHASVFFCERHGMSRYILCHYSACRQQIIKMQKLSYEDLLDTATGLLFTALASAKEQKKILAHFHNACDILDDGTTLEELWSRIAHDRFYVCTQRVHDGQAIMAFPVWENAELSGVIGISIEFDYFHTEGGELIAAGRKTAETVSRALSCHDVSI